MHTQEIIALALELAGLSELPADSGVIVPGEKIQKVLAGIDMETAEILLAKKLGCDLVLTHHPTTGSPRLNLHQVMTRQIDRMVEAGVPINKAQKAIKERIEEVGRALHVTNYDRAASAARLLGMPFVGVHTPADVLTEQKVAAHLEQAFTGKPRAKVGEVIEALLEITEYKNALTRPKAVAGSEEDFAGKVWVSMARGTGGGPQVARAYFEAGVGTLVVMHMQEDAIKAVKEQNTGNVIVAGHMASDSVGMNRFLDALEERGLKVIRAGGLVTG
jgi:putative NIF3 family GTP cyclohydrolase 1 type 2